MIHSFDQLLTQAREGEKKVIAVAAAQDKEVLLAVNQAIHEDIASFILVGDEPRIRFIAKRNGVDLHNTQVIHEPDKRLACRKAAELVSSGHAQLLMKGIVETAVIMRAVLDREFDLRGDGILSHVGVFQVPRMRRLLYVADAAMNIAPNLQVKKKIIENSLQVSYALGNNMPVVAVLCATEKPNEKMIATLDAQALSEMNKTGEISGCHVIGPVALDNAISVQAAKHKGIESPYAGKADILIVPQIESGNVLYKSLVFFAHAKNAGILVGAKVPVIVTSRADSDETKVHSIALGVLMANLNAAGNAAQGKH